MERLRVLFVDDEEALVSAVVERLELRDIEACGAINGAEALQMLDAQEFSVVVLDVRMPGLGGLDTLRRIKHVYPNLEVVMLSGHGSTEDVEEGLRLGAFAYLQKPVDIEELVDLIRTATEHGSGRGQRG
jgi:DNA-binding NtrC family response regulator